MSNYAEFSRGDTGGSPAPSEATEDQPVPRSIRSIRQLADALSSGDMATRLQALQAIQLQPKAALALGVCEGRDVIDILLARAATISETIEWMSWVGTLSAFRNPRVTDFFLNILANEESPQMLFSAGRYLSGEDLASLRERLLPLLLQNKHSVRARAVASLLDADPFLTGAAKLRTALLSMESEGGDEVPAFDQASSDLWLEELAGPFQIDAQIRLKAQGELAWAALAMLWQRLDERNQLWLLQWGSEEFCGLVGGLIPNALQSGSRELRLQALKALALRERVAISESLQSLAIAFLKDPDPEIRQAAVSASPAWLDWRTFLPRETIPAVRRACLTQLVRKEGEGAIPDLIGFLRSGDWQLRALSAHELAGLGDPAVNAVKPLVHDMDQRIRVTAVRILLDLQQESWLEHEFALHVG